MVPVLPLPRKLRNACVRAFPAVFAAFVLISCGSGHTGPPDIPPAQTGVVSQDPQAWSISSSAGTPDHPSAPPTAWALSLPKVGEQLYSVRTPFRVTARPQQIVVTFQITGSADAIPVATYADASPCRDHDPCTPVAEFHAFFKQQGDDPSSEIERWWSKQGFRMTNMPDDSYDVQPFVADGQPHTVTIPLTADQWTSVTGDGTAVDFETALKNVGYVGISFGGSDYFASGVNMQQGTLQFQLIEFRVE